MDNNAIVPVMGVSILNGIFSPAVVFVTAGYFMWYPGWLPTSIEFVYMASALIVSTLTLMLSGVPAALYERLSSAPRPSVTAAIWIVVAVVLTLPAIPNVLAAVSGQ